MQIRDKSHALFLIQAKKELEQMRDVPNKRIIKACEEGLHVLTSRDDNFFKNNLPTIELILLMR